MIKNINLTPDEQSFLRNWEEVYKKSNLTLWTLLALKDGPKHMALIQQFFQNSTVDLTINDNQSVYRALRRLRSAALIDFTLRISRRGPDLKQYYLTNAGHKVLESFLDRQIKPFYQESIKRLANRED